MEILLDVAQRLSSEQRIRFVFCGAGAARQRLFDAGRNLPNIDWLPLQPAERLNDLLNIADIHLLPQRADAADLVMPSKLAGMLASGRPVIATAAPGTQVAQVASEGGVVVRPGDAAALADAILRLADSPAERTRYARAGRAYALANLDCEAILGRFERALIGE